VFLVGGHACFQQHAAALRARPWIRSIALTDAGLTPAIDRLRRDHGIHRISAVGGRSTATALVTEGLSDDLYLTTGPRVGGVARTPWYVGAAAPALTVTTRKQWEEGGATVVFEHVRIG
jgi:hypothetical protein